MICNDGSLIVFYSGKPTQGFIDRVFEANFGKVYVEAPELDEKLKVEWEVK